MTVSLWIENVPTRSFVLLTFPKDFSMCNSCTWKIYFSQQMRLWYSFHCKSNKGSEPSLLAYINIECRWKLRPKFRPLAPLDTWSAWAFKGGFCAHVISTKISCSGSDIYSCMTDMNIWDFILGWKILYPCLILPRLSGMNCTLVILIFMYMVIKWCHFYVKVTLSCNVASQHARNFWEFIYF